MPSTATATSDRMQCMEVWGGNAPVDRGFGVPGLKLWVYSRAYQRAEGGGDVYYVSSCASGRITRLLLADVSGHGEAVADIATGLRDLMRSNVNLINQTRFVREMNRQFSEQSYLAGFATALVCTFFAPTRSLQFCNAGHPVPMLYRAEHGSWTSAQELARVERGDGLSDTPLGVIQEADYSRFETKMSPGDMVLCVSDAFTEALDSAGNMLGTGGLLKVVEELDISRPDEIIPELVERIRLQQHDNLSQDDATVLLFRADGSNPSLKENLLAPLRLLSRVRDNTGIN
jgi:sigma-B regulation protein RsbU (phosphoserine phosphatase)